MLFFVTSGALAFVLWAYLTLLKDPRPRGQLEAPIKRIGELGDNELGRVVGRVRCLDEQLEAPLSGRRCVYFTAMVTERELTVIRETRCVRFVLEDDSGRAIVDSTDASVAIEHDTSSHSGMFDPPTTVEQAFLAKHDETGDGWPFNRSLRYTEAVITEGMTIAVLGAGTREPDPDAPPQATYRGDARTRLRLTSSRKHPLVISDVHQH